MEYRRLGRSGLFVSSLTLGTMTFGGSGPFSKVGSTDVAGATRQVDMCLEAGVNLFDTADIYSSGESEEILGQAVSGRRDRLLLATKARFRTGEGPNGSGLSRHHIIRACEESLKRLGTDHIDLYQAHEWDGVTPLEETLEAFDTLVRSGKVRYVGCSNYAGWQLMKALGVSEKQGYQRYVSQQIHYTLEAREAEYELLPLSVDQGCGVLIWSPLASGLLSGKYRRDQEAAEGRRFEGWDEPPIRDEARLYDIIDVIVEVSEGRGVSAAQVALAWLLGRPGVSSIVVGARTDEQLSDNLEAADLKLTDEERRRLDDVSAPPLVYPFWHQLKTASDRLGPADMPLMGQHLREG
jgi:aryl-alcohol dehydrogenase-like predicted oxidoreductase